MELVQDNFFSSILFQLFPTPRACSVLLCVISSFIFTQCWANLLSTPLIKPPPFNKCCLPPHPAPPPLLANNQHLESSNQHLDAYLRKYGIFKVPRNNSNPTYFEQHNPGEQILCTISDIVKNK